MSLLQALRFPLRSPVRFVLLAGVHCLMWSTALYGISYSESFSGRAEATAVFFIGLIVLIFNWMWFHRHSIASLRRLFDGGGSPLLVRASDFLPLRLRSVVSTSVMISFVAMFAFVIQELRTEMWAYLIAQRGTEISETVSLLARYAVFIFVLALLTLLYVIGLARFATEGKGRTKANIVTNELVLFKNKRASFQYLVLQFLLLSGAVYVMELAIRLGNAVRPPSVRIATEGQIAWQTFGLFVYACGFVVVWNASLHLLAQYASEIGIRGDHYDPEKGKVDAF